EIVKVFRQMRPLAPGALVRGQFKGYRQEPGVAPGSNVETFAALRLDIDSWRWAGVPFYVRAGKCLPATVTEVVVRLKRPPLAGLAPGPANCVRLTLSPGLEIALGVTVKRPGEEMTGEPSQLSMLSQPAGLDMTAYERLLGDAMAGDSSLFAREDAVEAAWAVFEPVLRDPPAVLGYEPGTWGPAEARRLSDGREPGGA
ncbi:MAG TPA: glucose-6-phosphate dehydrogenase, partial [bacterium]|nr:glucose-6-phosphate dehydrogenase [bacterium]